MGLRRVKLGKLLFQSTRRNEGNEFDKNAVVGLSTAKEWTETKADLNGVNLASYKLFSPNQFAYVPDTSRRGDKVSLAFNETKETFLVSGISVVFAVSNIQELNPSYLFMYFNRPEFDRYARFNSWGSARETFNWEDLCDIEIELPPIEMQRKYVAIYEAMLANQQSYERGLADLKLVSDGFYDKFKLNAKRVRMEDLVREVDLRNGDADNSEVRGVSSSHLFIESRATLKDARKYKVVAPGQIACNLIHVGRDGVYPIAKNDFDHNIVVSPDYAVLEPRNADIGSYLMGWFSRSETGRHGWYICAEDIRGRMNIAKFMGLEVPVPDATDLHSIAELREIYRQRSEINDRLKAQLKDLCPILIKGSIDEARAS